MKVVIHPVLTLLMTVVGVGVTVHRELMVNPVRMA
jgi:hypothetical protein